MRLLTTLYVADHGGRVVVKDRSILVHRRDGTKTRVPVEAIEAVTLVGGVQITSDALALCAERGIRVAGITQNGRIRYVAGPAISGNVLLRLQQYRAAHDTKEAEAIARLVVAAKLRNTQLMLLRWASDDPAGPRRVLRRLAGEVAERAQEVLVATGGDRIRGIEGEGARTYFTGVRRHLEAANALLSFSTRTRRPPRDPVNALLSFAYALLTTELTGALDAIGLDPQVGFLHGVRPGRPALALDLLEEFRPSVADRFVVGLVTRRMLGSEDFVSTLGGACYLSDDGRRRFFEQYEHFKGQEVWHRLLERNLPLGALPVAQATLMARHLRGDLSAYAPYVIA